MPDVAEPVLPGHHGLDATERRSQRRSHLAHRVRLPAGHVVAAQRPFSRAAAAGPTTSPTVGPTAGNRLESEQVGPGHVADVHEVAALAAILEHPRRHAVLQAGAEDRGHARVGGVARHPRAVHVVVAQPDRDAASEPGPARSQVLLRHLARGVFGVWLVVRQSGGCGGRTLLFRGLETGRSTRLAMGGLDRQRAKRAAFRVAQHDW